MPTAQTLLGALSCDSISSSSSVESTGKSLEEPSGIRSNRDDPAELPSSLTARSSRPPSFAMLCMYVYIRHVDDIVGTCLLQAQLPA